jgi:hypothetical protein
MKQKTRDFPSLVSHVLQGAEDFRYQLSGYDKLWDIIFPHPEGSPQRVRILQYRETRYIFHVDGESCHLEVSPDGTISPSDSLAFSGRSWLQMEDVEAQWRPLFEGMKKWLGRVRKEWIKAAREMQDLYPLSRRFGYISKALVDASLPDLYHLDKELGGEACDAFIKLVEEGYFNRDSDRIIETMTARDFFAYCRIAYIAGKRPDDTVDEQLTGREMYKHYADGRHEGLLDIDETSAEEFSAWIDGSHPKRDTGGHPWEIKRGGNTTHIDLFVTRPHYRKEGFLVTLRAPALGRLAEALRMVLEIHREGLPIGFDDAEGVRKRLLGQDNIGIIPEYDPLHRANQRFDKTKDVYEVLYFSDLGRYKRRLTRFITWEPLPLLLPAGIPE